MSVTDTASASTPGARETEETRDGGRAAAADSCTQRGVVPPRFAWAARFKSDSTSGVMSTLFW